MRKVGYLVWVQLLTHIMIDPHVRKRMVRSHSTLIVWRLKLLNLLQKMTINRKN
ncbi:E3 ubiquitin-protein ligase ubr3 [Bienertia sinuspersici]